ncbi:MAG: glycoside hydrolase [Ignavibacteria bacterium]|nr:glycoside hydrolase [Ignavibacteria bacterium]
MAIKKQYLKSKPICKVTFRIPGEVAKDNKTASLVGDFNSWNPKKTKMEKLKKDGAFSVVLELDTAKEYQFRYLLDKDIWMNESEADGHILNEFGTENSVIKI